MCARRFLGCVFFLILIAVGVAFAIFQFGDRILARMATPTGHYQAPADPVPDYAKADAWLARPGNGPSLADWRPSQADGSPPPPMTLAPPNAATFYIHPTTYLANDRWNAPAAMTDEPENRAKLFVQSQASAFAGFTQVWAPRYRQAAFGAFLLTSDDANKALDLAYGDVVRAFDAFAAANPGKPLILAGHSQGSLHLLRLLRDRRDALKDRLVAAYVGGWPVDTKADLPVLGLPACSAPSQIACLLSWQSFGDPANPELIERAWVGKPGFNGIKHAKANMVCTNPLTGTSAPAPASANLGTLVPDGTLTSATLQPGKLGAHCKDGFLIIDGTPPGMGNYVMPGNNYHAYDYALWWGSIRADAERRLKAYQSQ